MKSHFFIVSDRANIRAYRAESLVPSRPPRLELVQAITMAHLGPQQRDTDAPGSFSVSYSGGSQQGRHQNSMAERHMDIEETRRQVKQMAEHINAILRQEKPGSWSFAAPGDIHEEILEHLDPQIRELLVEVLPRNLVKVPADELLEHFETAMQTP